MPSATASGSDAGGSQDRKYTPEQKAAVLRIRKCSGTAFYEILSLEKTATDSEIKKAYRKLSLVTHPDKNGYEGADEAFKSMSPVENQVRSGLLTSVCSGVARFSDPVGLGEEVEI